MRFRDSNYPNTRYQAGQIIEAPRIASYSEDTADLTFKYKRGRGRNKKEREILLTLSKDEVQDLLGELNMWLNDKRMSV